MHRKPQYVQREEVEHGKLKKMKKRNDTFRHISKHSSAEPVIMGVEEHQVESICHVI